MTERVLEFLNVSCRLGGARILDDVTFAVRRGDYVSLLGQNGAGKSTLLRCALGINRDFTGDIQVNGRASALYSARERARIIAYVPQNGWGAYPQTVFDFVMTGRYPHLGLWQTVQRSDEQAVERALELTETQSFKDRLMQSLSGGERQRVVIAAALAQEPEILLLDEVCHFLDPLHEMEIQVLLERVNREQKVTMLSVTHNLNHAACHSSRVVALKAGRVAFNGLPQEFMQAPVLEEVYGTKFLFTRHPGKDIQLVIPGA